MYTLQSKHSYRVSFKNLYLLKIFIDSQVNDIDSLLEELCEYENTLNLSPAHNFNLISNNINQKPRVHKDASINISKQFDDVLKLISDSIDEPLNVTIQNQTDSQYTSSVNSSPKSQENISSSCSTSSSSGIVFDENLKNNKNNNQTQNQEQLCTITVMSNNLPKQQQQQQQQPQHQQVGAKRNSSDSAFSDSISLPSSQSIGTLISSAIKLQNGNSQTTQLPTQSVDYNISLVYI